MGLCKERAVSTRALSIRLRAAGLQAQYKFVRSTMWRLPFCQFCMLLRLSYSIFIVFFFLLFCLIIKLHNFIIYFLPIAIVQMLSDRIFSFSATTHIPPAHAIHSISQIATRIQLQPHCLYCEALFSSG